MSGSNCPYCAGEHTQKLGQVYCSNSGQRIDTPSNAIFIMPLNSLDSGRHLTRLTLRFVLRGRQDYFAGRSQKRVDEHHYMLMNHGQEYRTIVPDGQGAVMLGVAYKPAYAAAYLRSRTSDEASLLDDPFDEGGAFSFFEGTQTMDADMRSYVMQIRSMVGQAVIPETAEALHNLYTGMLDKMIAKQEDVKSLVAKIPASRLATREELLRRLLQARDYIDACCHTLHRVEEVAQNSYLSSFHFIRSFRQVFGITPYSYLIDKKLEYALRLLKKGWTVSAASMEAGFEHHSSFTRLFSKRYGMAPVNFRYIR